MRSFFSPVWSCILLAATLVLTASAGTFHVKKGVIKDVEGAIVQTMIIQTDTDQLSFVPLYGYATTILEKEQRIDFKSPDGKIAYSLILTNTFAGTAPDEDQLKSQAEALYPGSSVLQTGAAIAPTGNGQYVDVFRLFLNGARMTTRHAYLPFKDQTLEVVFTSESQSFEKNRRELTSLIGTFKMEPVTANLVLPESGK